jgi:SAM-dependent methyltransferase
MTQPEAGNLRTTFDQVAELYDAARPRYLPEIFEDLGRLDHLGPGSRVLEIGPGTGQATSSLAELGHTVVAVELGSDLAKVARHNLAGFPTVEVVNAAFEDWPLPEERFDLVFAATAWKWLDPKIRVRKAADALVPGGSLATLETDHIRGGTQPFFDDSQACYERWDPDTTPGFRYPTASEIPRDSSELTDSGLFSEPTFYDYEADIEYSAAQYLDVLRTYSPNIAMSADRRDGLLNCLRKLIDEKYRSRITKRYLWRLRVVRLAPSGTDAFGV